MRRIIVIREDADKHLDAIVPMVDGVESKGFNPYLKGDTTNKVFDICKRCHTSKVSLLRYHKPHSRTSHSPLP